MYCDHKSRSVRFFLGHQTCGGLGKPIACCVFKPRDLTQRARSQRRDADERGKELDRKIGAGKWDGTPRLTYRRRESRWSANMMFKVSEAPSGKRGRRFGAGAWLGFVTAS